MRQSHADIAAFRRELVGVADQIQQDAVQSIRVAKHHFIFNFLCGNDIVDLLHLHLHREKIAHFIQQFHNIRGYGIQFHLAALNAAHVQNVVDERQQMLAGQFDFLQIFRRFRREAGLLLHQADIAHDGVHRRPDVMAHVRKERALRLTAPLRAVLFLLHLVFTLNHGLVDIEHDEQRQHQKRHLYQAVLRHRAVQPSQLLLKVILGVRILRLGQLDMIF